MAIIGFLALVALGGFLVFAGVVANLGNLGFSGKYSVEGFVMLAIGAALLYTAWVNSPLSVVVKGGV